jgi:hypothetical protein
MTLRVPAGEIAPCRMGWAASASCSDGAGPVCRQREGHWRPCAVAREGAGSRLPALCFVGGADQLLRRSRGFHADSHVHCAGAAGGCASAGSWPRPRVRDWGADAGAGFDSSGRAQRRRCRRPCVPTSRRGTRPSRCRGPTSARATWPARCLVCCRGVFLWPMSSCGCGSGAAAATCWWFSGLPRSCCVCLWEAGRLGQSLGGGGTALAVRGATFEPGFCCGCGCGCGLCCASCGALFSVTESCSCDRGGRRDHTRLARRRAHGSGLSLSCCFHCQPTRRYLFPRQTLRGGVYVSSGLLQRMGRLSRLLAGGRDQMSVLGRHLASLVAVAVVGGAAVVAGWMVDYPSVHRGVGRHQVAVAEVPWTWAAAH